MKPAAKPSQGFYPLNAYEISFLKEDVFLANAGSGGTEFDIRSLRRLSTKIEKVTNHITRYVLPNSQNIYLLRDGEPVNFHIQSVPNEVIDLVFSEIILSMLTLVRKQGELPRKVLATDVNVLSYVAKAWLNQKNGSSIISDLSYQEEAS